jgi:hypothetical protein
MQGGVQWQRLTSNWLPVQIDRAPLRCKGTRYDERPRMICKEHAMRTIASRTDQSAVRCTTNDGKEKVFNETDARLSIRPDEVALLVGLSPPGTGDPAIFFALTKNG